MSVAVVRVGEEILAVIGGQGLSISNGLFAGLEDVEEVCESVICVVGLATNGGIAGTEGHAEERT